MKGRAEEMERTSLFDFSRIGRADVASWKELFMLGADFAMIVIMAIPAKQAKRAAIRSAVKLLLRIIDIAM